jgi:GT2 family glycosyltransferase
MDKTAVVILNWNGKGFLQQFLPSIIKFTNTNSSIYIADNGSTDDSVIFLKTNFPTVKLIELPKNLGFAEGYNQVLKQIKSEYYILLNSDVEVTSGWLEPLVQLMDSDKTIAAVMPKLLDFNNKEKFEYAGAAGGFIDKYFFRARLMKNNMMIPVKYFGQQVLA